MAENLLIVESPAKSKTIKKYLGHKFEVMASYGHVRDLVAQDGAVDPDNGFAMNYQVMEDSIKHVRRIEQSLKKAQNLYLATDPDREGEAISWHLYELLKERGTVKNKGIYRVVFHEITRRAITDAVAHPRELSADLVNAQQARRALDHLVGFNLSPLLWRKVQGGLSAGRVQSPALRLVVEREEEIEQFKVQEYWTVEAACEKNHVAFNAKLFELDGQKLKQFDISNEAQAQQIRTTILDQAQGSLKVVRCEKKQRKRYPSPPFITSTLQQESARKLRFSPSRTMRVAQQLYEGVDLGSGPVGLISYMRTDSVTLAESAIAELRAYIEAHFGSDKLPPKAQRYKTKSKNAQEAHEAIRPTSAERSPNKVKSYLSADQHKLYDLIWKRTIACQMIHATLDTVTADLTCQSYCRFRANGSTIKDPGFMTVYQESHDKGSDNGKDTDKGDDKQAAAIGDKKLPPLSEGEEVPLKELNAVQHFTEPPPRYSEASLIKTLEEYGIGRPSTYANILSTLQYRDYVTIEKRRFYPTSTGRIVSNFLTNHFATYVDYGFTAKLEDALDEISRGERKWVPMLEGFWRPFKKLVDDKGESVSKAEASNARLLGDDPETNKPVSVRYGRYGPFVQIGSKDDTEKPRFASLRSGQKIETISLSEALELFKLPRDLGETPEGDSVSAGIGRFGPFIKYGKRYVSLKDDDPHDISLARALQLIAEKKQSDAEKIIADFPRQRIQILKGRYGPYITDGTVNAKVPKEQEPSTLTAAQCLELIAAADKRKRVPPKKNTTKKSATKKKPASKKKRQAS